MKNRICTTYSFYYAGVWSARTHHDSRPNEGDLNIETNETVLDQNTPGFGFILSPSVETRKKIRKIHATPVVVTTCDNIRYVP